MHTRIDRLQMLSDPEKAALGPVAERYAFRVSDYYLGLINWDDSADPIRRIVIPNTDELEEFGRRDPSDESTNYVVRGCQHKYRQTALLLVSQVCESYCRFCFRKRLFQNGQDEVSLDISPGLAYIRSQPEISNVLLTGGDPLMLSTSRLDHILTALREIPHVQVIRLGSKSLAFNPARVLDDPDFIPMLERHTRLDKRIYLMAHYDHPREVTELALRAITAMQRAGVAVVHQCPLLRGVNDNPTVLAELLDKLSWAGVTPYYIFQNRPVMGNASFVVPLAEGYRIVEEAKDRVSGLARRTRYVMSHATGKLEVLAVLGDQIILKYHQARHAEDQGRVIQSKLPPNAGWLDDLPGYQAGGSADLGKPTEGMARP